MHTTVTTTITNRIDLDTFKPDVYVDIAAEDDLPHDMIYAAVIGSARALLGSVHDEHPRRVEDAVRKMCKQFGIETVDAD